MLAEPLTPPPFFKHPGQHNMIRSRAYINAHTHPHTHTHTHTHTSRNRLSHLDRHRGSVHATPAPCILVWNPFCVSLCSTPLITRTRITLELRILSLSHHTPGSLVAYVRRHPPLHALLHSIFRCHRALVLSCPLL